MPVVVRDLDPERQGELDRAVDVLARALMRDPLYLWLFPGERQRERALRWIVRQDIKRALLDGFVLVDDELRGVNVVVRREGREPVGRLRRARRAFAFARAMYFDWRALWRTRQSIRARKARWLEASSDERTAWQRPHFYFALHGVDPSFQGQGIGGAIERVALARADEAGLPGQSGTNSHDNVALYERFGWRVIAERTLEGARRSGTSSGPWVARITTRRRP